MDVIESDSGCILVTNEGDYPSKFGQHFLTAWDNYRLYLLDGKCVGIAGISEEEAEVYNTYIKAVEDGTLTFYPVVQNMRLQWMHRKRCDRRRGGSCFFKWKAPDRAKKRTGDRWKIIVL